MKVLLDENLPELLVTALRRLGHEVESINSLRLKGLDNGTLYREAAQGYDLSLTKDAGFVQNARGMCAQAASSCSGSLCLRRELPYLLNASRSPS